jgi:hypothetical protein
MQYATREMFEEYYRTTWKKFLFSRKSAPSSYDITEDSERDDKRACAPINVSPQWRDVERVYGGVI